MEFGVARVRLVLACGLLVALSAGLAPAVYADSDSDAEDDDPFDRPGVYVGIGGAWGKSFTEKFATLTGTPEFDDLVDIESTGGLNARVGYRFYSWVAVEGMYEWMADFNTVSRVNQPALQLMDGQTVWDLTTHTLTANLKLLVPFWRLQPYVLLGIGAQYRKLDAKVFFVDGDSGWAFAGRPGIGIDWYITENLVMNLEASGVLAPKEVKIKVNQIEGVITDNVYMSLGAGLQYRF